MTDRTGAPSDDLTRLIAGLVPPVPSEEARGAIRRIFGAVGPGQNDRHMDHWNRGKTIQFSRPTPNPPVPFKHEEEHATGLYDRELRPRLIGALLAWAAEHGAPIDGRRAPKVTNDLVLVDRGYRVERDRENARIELFRPDLTLALSWRYGEQGGQSGEGYPTLAEIREAIERDIEQADG